MKARVRMRSNISGNRCIIWVLIIGFSIGAVGGISQCPDLTAPDNGNVNVAGVNVNDTAAYTCKTGYTLDGTNFRECQAGFTWSESAPTCNIVDCGTPADPVGGVASYANTTYLSTLNYSCNTGFNLTAGETSATCMKDGNWDNSPPTCTIDDCLGLSNITDGSVSAPVTTFGATATYTCDTGYYISSGSQNRTCQAGGSWDGTEPTCSIQDCLGLSAPAGGSVAVTTTTYSSTANYSCDTGYDINGTATITCQADGNWETLPTCDIKDCGNLTGPTDGSVNFTSTTYSSVATFTCDTGYTLVGDSSATCIDTSAWSASAPVCNIVDCGTLEQPDNGNVNFDPGTVYQKIAAYTCDTGYELRGDNIRRCEASGNWSSTPPTCQIYDCSAPEAPTNGNVTLTSGLTTYGEQARYTCDTGYNENGTSIRTCGEGTWSGSLLTCDDINECVEGTDNCNVNAACANTDGSFTCTCNPGYSGDGLTCDDCGTLSNPADGTVSQTGTTLNDTATYICNTGYEQMGGNLTRTCETDGTWSGAELVCTIEDCGSLSSPTDGTVNYTDSTYQQTATYTCNTGYQQTGGNISRTCQAGGAWDGTEIVCQIYTCTNLTDPADGNVTATGNSYGDTGTYSCDPGYDLNGSSLLTCGTGTWDNAEPNCTKKDCRALSNPPDGTVNMTGTVYLETATYACNSGYEQTGGNLTRTCGTDGSWDGTEIVCTIEDCGSLSSPAGGTVNYTDSTYLETATYSCNTGYQQTEGNISRTCQAGGAWDGTDIVCQIYTCTNLTDPADGNMTATGNSYGDTGTYSCDPGYDLNGSSVLTCGTGTWDNAEPNCTKKDCLALSNPPDGTVSVTGTVYLETATYACNTGYEQTGGNLTRTCGTDGSWDGTELECTIEDCGSLLLPAGGTVNYTDSTYLETATYSCNTGYQQTGGNISRTCQAGGAWDGTEIVCQIYTCTNLTDPADGNVTVTGNSYGDTGTYSCDPGYDLNGSSVLTCGTGTWDNAEPNCTKKDCLALSNPPDGTVSVTGTVYLETATYVCNTGYEQTGGNLTRTCGTDGSWDGTELVCTIEDCGSLSPPAGGTVNYTASTYLETATYSCNTGYQQTGGNTSRTCQAGGAWDGTEIVCQIYTCTNLTDPADGNMTATGNSYGDTGTYSCDPGYDLNGSSLLTCGTGTWDNAEPNCTIKDCGTLSTVLTNGTASQNGTKYLDTTVYTCNVGYMISRGTVNLTVTCQANGTWDGSVPTCVRTDCGDLTKPSNGQVNTQPGTLYQKLASYTCNQGYDLIGVNVRECQADGIWDGAEPTCQIIDCGNLTNPTNGSVDMSSGTTFFKVASYTCDTGYELTGNADRTCQLDGNWNGTDPTCSRKNCGSLSAVLANGTATQSGTLYEDTTIYTCDTGYYISRGVVSKTVTCTASGSWDGTIVTCIPVDCGDLGAPDGGQIDYPDTNYNTRASYTCNVGHDLNGTNVRRCGADGNWDGNEPVCQIKDCGSLGDPTDGSVAAPVTTYGQTAVYTCDTGYYIATGSATRYCDESGQWNGTEPTCVIYDCQSPDNGTFCTMAYTTTTYGSTAVYACNTGYYKTAGDLTRTCGDGMWNGTAPTCTIRDCGSLSNPVGGTVTAILTTYSEVAVYACDRGYYNNGGDSERTCQADGMWNGTELQCTIYDCGVPSNAVFGTVNYTSTTYGSDAVYSCNTGYYTNDTVIRTCGNGTWSGSVPTCTIYDCGALSTNVSQGSVNISGSTYLETAVYTCDTGYLISGSSSNTLTLTCAADGSWDAVEPTCDAVDCGSMVAPFNGDVDTSAGTGYLDVAAYTCNHGYRLSGNNTRTCLADGRWSDSAPVCIIYDCGFPPQLVNGSVSVTVTTFSATVVYQCDIGYYQSAGDDVRTCVHGGSWNGTQPTCTLYDCGLLSDPTDGEVNVTGQTYGEMARYTCNTGYYKTAGDSTRACGNGTWSGDEPTCSIRDCGQLQDPPNGQVFLNGSTTYMQVANYSCNTGFHRSRGDSLRTCEADGNWNGTELICIIYDCGSLSDIGDGDVTLTGTTFNETATYTCDPGYYISTGDITRTCMEGFWSGAQPVCTIYDCGSAGTLVNGRVVATGTKYMDRATYTCNTGYLINGTESPIVMLVCLDGGDWSGQFPTCFYVDCGMLQPPDNGMVDVSEGTGLDDRAAYTCSTGYDLVGINVRTCQPSGLWDGEKPVCKIKDCGDLGNPVNGEVTVTGTTYGEKATYVCNVGYYVSSGNSTRTCRSSGVWDGTDPICTKSIETTRDPLSGDERDMVCGHRNEDLVFGITVSSMTKEADFLEMKNLVKNAVLRSDINSGDMRIGVFVFSQQIDHVIHLNEYNTSSELIQAVDAIPYNRSSGPSQLGFGLTQISAMFDVVFGDRPAVPNYVFIVLDDNVNMTGSEPVAKEVRDDGIHVDIMAAGFTNASMLANIAYKPQGHVFLMQSLNVLHLYVKFVLWKDSSCDCGTIDSQANGDVSMTGTFYLDTATFTCNEGYNLIGSRLLTCQYGGSWSGSPPTCLLNGSETTKGPSTTAKPDTAFCGYMNGDIFIALAVSRTVDQSDFDHMKSLAQSIIDHSDIDGGSTRLGLFVFDTSVRGNTVVGLNDYNTRSALLQAVNDIEYSPSGGSSNLSASLQQIKTMSSDMRQSFLLAYIILDQDVSYIGASQLADQLRNMGVMLSFAAVGFANLDTLGTLAFAPNPAYVWQIPNSPAVGYVASQVLFKDEECNCGSPSAPLQGSVSVTGTHFLDVATFSCNVGYDLVGSEEIVCQYGGSWNGSSPTCSPRVTVATTPPTVPPELETTCGIHNLDIVYGIGVSSEMTEGEYSSVKNLVFTTIHRADIDFGLTRFGFFLFDTMVRAESVIHLRQYSSRADMILAIDSITFQPASSPVQLSVGLEQILTMFSPLNGNRPGISNMAVIALDSNVDTSNSTIDAEQLKNNKIDLGFLTVGFDRAADLEKLAYSPLSVYSVDTYGILNWAAVNLIFKDEICSCGKLDDPAFGSVVETGSHFLDVASFSCIKGYELTGSQQLVCQYNHAWSGSPPTCSQSGPGVTSPPRPTINPKIDCGLWNADVVVGIATSAITSETDFRNLISMVKTLASLSDIDSGSAKFGFFIFDALVYQSDVISLGEYDSTVDLLAAIDRIQYTRFRSMTRLSYGLQQVLSMFSAQIGGNRADIPDHAFIVTGTNVLYYDVFLAANQIKESGIMLHIITDKYNPVLASLTYPADGHFIELSALDMESFKAVDLFRNTNCNCGIPSTPTHGSVNFTDTYYLAVATYSCDLGYDLIGSRQIVCQDRGKWMGSPPTCSQTSTTPKPTEGPLIDITCGFQNVDVIFGLAVSSSVSSGEFEAMKIFLGGVIEHTDIDNGTARLGSFVFDTSVRANTVINLNNFSSRSDQLTAVINLQYSPSGNQSVLSAGLQQLLEMFSSPTSGRRIGVPAMAFIVTGSSIVLDGLPLSNQLRNADIVLSFLTVDFNPLDKQKLTELSFSPDNNYNMDIPSFLALGMATSFGMLFQDGECDCGVLPSPSNGSVTFKETIGGLMTYYLDIASFMCNQGFQLVGSQQLVCQYGGTWNGLPPTCIFTGVTGITFPTSPTPTTPGLPDIDTECGFQNLDVIYGIALSRSISEIDFEHIKNLIKTGTDSADIDTSSTQLGFFIYGNGFAVQSVALDRYKTRSDLHRAIESYQYIQSNNQASLPLGLVIAQNMFLSSANRAAVPDILYMILDDNVDMTGASEVIEQIKAARIHLDLIAVGFPNSSEIHTLGRVIEFDSFEGLGAAITAEGLHRSTECNCGDLTSPSNGEVLFDDTYFLDVATFSCNQGYDLVGSQQLVCQYRGLWNDLPPTCIQKASQKSVDMLISLNMTVRPDVDLTNNQTYKDEVRLALVRYYIKLMKDSAVEIVINSLSFGSLVINYTVVIPNTETSAQEFAQSTVSLAKGAAVEILGESLAVTDMSIGEEPVNLDTVTEESLSCRTFTAVNGACDFGYICQFEGDQPSCIPDPETGSLLDCGYPGSFLNGMMSTVDGTLYGKNATYICNTGYMLEGSNTRTCQPSGLWVPEAPRCLLIDCGSLSSPENGLIDLPGGTTFGQIATFSCHLGYILQGQQELVCTGNSVWDNVAPTCQINDLYCGGVLDPQHGSVSTSDLSRLNSTATYRCNTGYRMVGPETRTCSENMAWEPDQDTECIIQDCGILHNPLNGNVDQSSGTTYGQTVTFSCSVGYQIFGAEQATCTADGSWSTTSPLCQITNCGGLPNPENGLVSASQTTFGQVATYECKLGYTMSGTSSRICQPDGSWSGREPSCSPRDCGQLFNSINGFVNVSMGTTFGSVATYSCREGYSLVGQGTSQCNYTGTWNPPVTPTCVVIDCGILVDPQFGSVALSQGTRFKSLATYRCDTGYELRGPTSRECLSTGKWSNVQSQTSCSRVDCSELQAPINGIITYTAGTSLGSQAIFDCDHGFYMTGSNISLCSEGSWTHTTPLCTLQDCGSIAQPVDGSVSLTNGTVFNSIAEFTCNTGYRLSGPRMRTCSDSGKWKPKQGTKCLLHDCGMLQNPVNGNVDQSSGTTYGQTVQFSCSVGYEIFGSSQAICMADGTWSNAAPLCQVTDCGGLSSPDNGLVSASQTTFGQVATYTCAEGYSLSGTSSRICQPDGSWSSSPPLCLVKDCGSLPDPVFGRVEYSSSLYGSVAVYRCDVGYSLQGVSGRNCAADGRWSGTTPTCITIDCGTLSSIRFGSYKPPQRNVYGTTVTISCDTGYRLNGNATVTCLQTSQWSPLPSCVIRDCGDLSRPDNGLVSLPGGTTYGQTALFSCQTGYLPTGPTELQCTEDGIWNGSPPACQHADCGILSDPMNGGVTISGTKFGAYATYVCDAGHQITGSPSRLCQEDGTWSGSSPSCIVRDCGQLTAPARGNVSVPSGTTYGNIAKFSCNEKYDLVGLSAVVCRADGTWSAQPPVCTLKDGLISKDLTIRLNMTAPPGLTLSNPFTYNAYQLEVKTVLTQHYGTIMKDGIVDLIVNSLQLGSLIVDYTVVLQDSEGAVKDFTEASLRLALGSTLEVFNENLGVNRMTVDDSLVNLLSLSAEELACRLFLEMSGPCQTGYICTLVANSPECRPDPSTDCGIPANPSNGAVDYSRGTLFGDTVIYTCNSGYTLVGHNTRTCQGGGNWAPDAPTCSLTDCGTLSDLANGLVVFGGTVIGQTAFYSCNPGYSLIGASVVTCQLDGTWSNPPPTCRITGCGGLSNPLHGTVTVSTDGSVAQYTCQTGFYLTGDSLRTCLVSKLWSGSAPTCRAVECFNLPDPLNGRVDITGTSYGSTATYHCTRVGYKMSGPDTRVCGQDGQWSGNAPSCDIIECDVLPPLPSGNIDMLDRTYGQTVSFTCNQGYILQGAQTLTCMASGWSGTPPICRSSGDCGSLDNPMYGYVTFSLGTAFLSKATFSCYVGYKLTGSTERVCQADNTWSGTPTTCILVDCGQPVSSDGGRVTYTSGTTYGRVATYTCNSGYDLIGPATVTCQNNGTWTYKPICRAKDCGSPPNPLNGLVDIVAGTTFGSTAVYTCNPGYYRQGASARTCLATGYWDNLVPTCVVRDCGPLATPTHGVVNVPLGTTYGQTATYYCNPGYTLSGTASRQCAVDGLWTGFSPVCIGVVCGSLSRPGNGQVSLSQGLGVGSVATYTCNPGYVLSPANNAARTCKMNGTWTGTPPVCIFIDCGSLSAPMFGEIVIDQTTFGHKALYTCNQGYMMSGSKERRCNTDGYWSGTRPVCTVTDCGSLNHPDNGKVMMPEGTLFGHTAVYKCNSGYTLKNYYKRTCQSNGTWSGAAPSCESSREFALAVGLGVGLTGFVILVMVIVLIVVILYRRNHSKHYGRMSRMYTFPRPVTVPPPLPVKINTGPTMFVPFYNGPAVVDDDSNISDRHTTWRSRKADYGDPANPLYYNTTMPGAEYYSFHR